MQSPSHPQEDTSGNFEPGGWASPYWPEVMEDVRNVAMDAEYDLVLGRKTYELFAPHSRDISYDTVEARRLNMGTKYVVSRKPPVVDWKKTEELSGSVAQKIEDLKKTKGPLLQIHGSWQLIQLLTAERLIDEYRIWTFPLALGRGKRLFDRDTGQLRFQRTSTRVLNNGVCRAFLKPIQN